MAFFLFLLESKLKIDESSQPNNTVRTIKLKY